VALVGGVAAIFVMVRYAAGGHRDREAEDAARDFYTEHGRWPDEEPDR
jgi:uroporphyrinogen-III decarboxylase